MQRYFIIVGFIALLRATSLQSALIETFDNDTGGWKFTTVKNNGQVNYYDPAWHPGDGESDGGYISAPLDSSGNRRLYGLEPADASIFGDMTGLTLTVDTRLDGLIEGPGDMPSARFYVGTYSGGQYNYFVSNDTFSWNPDADTTWTTHQVELKADNFILWPNQAARSKTFDQVIAAVEDIGLVFTDNVNRFTSNRYLGHTGSAGAQLSLDNFGTFDAINQDDQGTVPEPSAWIVLLFGSIPTCMHLRRNTA